MTTTLMRQFYPAVLLVAAVAAMSLSAAGQTGSTPAQPAKHGVDLPLGNWRGDSICVVRESACHDEKALYHVKRHPNKPGGFSMQADKIVDGKPEMMGTSDCSYDAEKHTLHCQLERGSIHLTLAGDKMEGSMLLADKTLWRRISLKKDK